MWKQIKEKDEDPDEDRRLHPQPLVPTKSLTTPSCEDCVGGQCFMESRWDGCQCVCAQDPGVLTMRQDGA